MKMSDVKLRFKDIKLPLYSGIALALSFIFIGDTKGTFLILMLVGFSGLLISFMWRDLREPLLFGLCVALPINMGKAVFAAPSTFPVPLNIMVADVFLFPLVAWVLLRKAMYREPFRVHKILVAGLLFVGWTYICTGANDLWEHLIVAIGVQTKFFLTAWVFAETVRTQRHLRIVLLAFMVGLLLQSLMSVAQMVKGQPIQIQGLLTAFVGVTLQYSMGEVFRPSGFTGHPNAMGDYLVFLIPTMILFFYIGPKRLGKFHWWVNLAALVLAIAMPFFQ